jgi:uncharacterized protein YkwD
LSDSVQVGRILVLVFVAAAFVAGTADARSHDARMPAATAVQVSTDIDLQDQVLVAINAVRRTHGLSELRLNASLSLAALRHSQSMARRGFFSHDGYNGAPFWSRIKPRYRPLRGNFRGVGENMVWASPDLSADQAVKMWLESPPHRKNLLTRSWREVGLGAVHALGAPGIYQGLDVTILTADFGFR